MRCVIYFLGAKPAERQAESLGSTCAIVYDSTCLRIKSIILMMMIGGYTDVDVG